MHKGAVELNYSCAYSIAPAVAILNGLSWYGYNIPRSEQTQSQNYRAISY
jgi:hypothetical protein